MATNKRARTATDRRRADGVGTKGKELAPTRGRQQPRRRPVADDRHRNIAAAWRAELLAYWSGLSERPLQQTHVMQFLDRCTLVAPLNGVDAAINLMQALRACNMGPEIALVVALGAGASADAVRVRLAAAEIKEAIMAFAR